MRVLYFTDRYTVHDRRFLEKLVLGPHEIHFLTLEGSSAAYEKRPLPDPVHPVFWDSEQTAVGGCTIEGWMQRLPQLEGLMRQIQPDLVHAGPVQSCGFLTALTDFRPFLVMSWGSDILVDADRDDVWRWITQYTLRHAERLLCDCQAVRERVQQLVPYPDEKIIQFPWGIDLDLFQPGFDSYGIREKLGWQEQVVILSTRTWEAIYGVEVLLEAFNKAYAQNAELRLILLGDGSLAPVVRTYITEQGLEEVVYCPGRISHALLPAYFQCTDLYISCSYSDGTSISLLEALATGLPVIVTDAPGNREWVIPGENGWLAPAADAGAFAEALLQAAALSARERERFRYNNLAVARARADWDRNVERLLQAYAQLEDEAERVRL